VLGPQCRWQGGGVGHSSPLVPFVGGVLSWLHHCHVLVSCHCLITWCCSAIVVAWLLSVVVVVVVSHHCGQSFVARKDNDEQHHRSLSSCHVDDVAPVSWSGRGLWGWAVGA